MNDHRIARSPQDGSARTAWPQHQGGHHALKAALLAIALTVTACSPGPASPPPHSGAPSAAPGPSSGSTLSPDAAAKYREIAAEVSGIRQLDASDRVEPVVIDGATLIQNIQAEFDKSNPPSEIAKSERILRILGLLAPDVSLARVYIELQGSQVIGYYDPTVRRLFLVSRDGALGAIEEVTYAHEFTHELQDLQFDLQSLGLDTIKDDSDRVLAILSLVEGDAVSVQTSWMLTNLTATQLAEVAAEASDPAMLEVLARTPRILLETSLFPYQAGAAFVARLQALDGYAGVDAAYLRLPASTEQILHPDAYLTDERPVRIDLPADLSARFGAGWSVLAADTLGELQTRVWLREGGVLGDIARIAAEGWGGDRLTAVDGPGGASAVVWVTAWDSARDATEFVAAAREAIGGIGLDAMVATSGMRVVIGIRSDGTVSDATLRPILEDLARS